MNQKKKNDNNFIQKIKSEIETINTTQKAIKYTQIANRYYRETPEENNDILDLCEEMIQMNMGFFSIATLWFKRRKELLKQEYFPKVENWLYSYISNWGRCDQFCYRILSPFVYKYPQFYDNVLKWIDSDKIYVRRAGAVSLIKNTGITFSVDYELSKVLNVINNLVFDSHHHIQKAIGWVLKYAYLSYPDEIIMYLKENRERLSRTTFRYGLEKMPNDLRQKMMKL